MAVLPRSFDFDGGALTRYLGDPATLTLIRNDLTRAGVEFIDDNAGWRADRGKTQKT